MPLRGPPLAISILEVDLLLKASRGNCHRKGHVLSVKYTWVFSPHVRWGEETHAGLWVTDSQAAP